MFLLHTKFSTFSNVFRDSWRFLERTFQTVIFRKNWWSFKLTITSKLSLNTFKEMASIIRHFKIEFWRGAKSKRWQCPQNFWRERWLKSNRNLIPVLFNSKTKLDQTRKILFLFKSNKKLNLFLVTELSINVFECQCLSLRLRFIQLMMSGKLCIVERDNNISLSREIIDNFVRDDLCRRLHHDKPPKDAYVDDFDIIEFKKGNVNDRFIDRIKLVRWCGCLFRRTNRAHVDFSHKTIPVRQVFRKLCSQKEVLQSKKQKMQTFVSIQISREIHVCN